MRLRVTGDYRSSLGEYRAGQVVEVSDATGELLMRDSPGSFRPDEAMSSETATGLIASDRRARGGRIR